MNKLIYFLLTVLIAYSNVQGQVTLQYKTSATATATAFTLSDVNSDFGRRRGDGTISNWHKGVDLNPSQVPPNMQDKGYQILTPVSGTVLDIKATGSYHYIVIQDSNTTNRYDFGYGHIFMEGTFPKVLGGMVFARINEPNTNNKYAIIDIAYNRAFGSVTGTVTYNSKIYNVVTQVQIGWAIAPLGDSDANGNPHLHLYRPNDPNIDPQAINNARNPLQILNLLNTAYVVSIPEVQNLKQLSSTTYYPGTTEAVVKVKALMSGFDKRGSTGDTWYTNTVMNVDSVKLYIKKSTDPIKKFSFIKGASYLSVIYHGGLVGNFARYPSNGYPIGNTFDISVENGKFKDATAARTGIYPTAYYGDGFDEYYFANIYTQIHKDAVFGLTPKFANIPDNAKYPDGYYNLFAQVVTIKNTKYPNTIPTTGFTDIVIDNFKPYIRKIDVTNPGIIFSGEWKINGTNLQYYGTNTSTYINDYIDINITVWTSEPTKSLTLTIGSAVFNPQPGNPVTDQWNFVIPMGTFFSTQNIDMVFKGKDIADNDLLNMPDVLPAPAVTTIALTNMPQRTSSTAFSNPLGRGNDETFSFVRCSPASSPGTALKSAGVETTEASCSRPEDDKLPVANFSFTVGGVDNNQATFVNNSINGDYYTWDFGDGTISHDPTPQVHTFPVETYTYSYNVLLTVSNEGGETDELLKKITISGTNDDDDANLTGSSFETTNEFEYIFDFYLSETDPLLIYTYFMDFGDGIYESIPNLNEFTHQYSQGYTHGLFYPSLTVSVYNGTSFVRDYQYRYLPISVNEIPPQDMDIQFGLSNGFENKVMINEEVNLTATTTNGQGKHTYYWSIDEVGTTENDTILSARYTASSSDVLTYVFKNESSYIVTLYVYDDYGNEGHATYPLVVSTSSGCYNLLIGAPGCTDLNNLPLGKPVQFGVSYSNPLACYGNSLGEIDWYLDGNFVSSSCKMDGLPESFKCITFYSAGPHTITVKAYPWVYYKYLWDDDLDRSIINIDNSAYYSIASIKVKVSDCIDNSLLLINADTKLHEDMTPTSGTINFCSISGSIVTVNNAETVVATGREEISIKPGFSASVGSNFNCQIIPCVEVCTECTDNPITSACESFTHAIPPEDEVNLEFLAGGYNDPCSGGFKMAFSVDGWGGPYQGAIQLYCHIDDNHNCNDKGDICNENCYHATSGYIAEGQEWYYQYDKLCKQHSMDSYVTLRAGPEGISYKGPSFSMGGLSGSKSEILDTINGMSIKNNVFKIYPNPAGTSMNVEIMENITDVLSITIFNSLGQRIVFMDSDIAQINQFEISDWKVGIYLVQVSSKSKLFIEKLVKK